MVTHNVRFWFDLLHGATIPYLPRSYKQLGLDLILPSMLAELCKLSVNVTLLHSKDFLMSTLHGLAPRSTPIPFYALLTQTSSKAATKSVKSIQVCRQLQKLGNLQIQSTLIQALRDSLPSTELASWSSHIALKWRITSAICLLARPSSDVFTQILIYIDGTNLSLNRAPDVMNLKLRNTS